MNAQYIGQQFKKCRKTWGISIEKAANDLNLPKFLYQQIETGEYLPSNKIIAHFAFLSWVDFEYLTGGNHD